MTMTWTTTTPTMTTMTLTQTPTDRRDCRMRTVDALSENSVCLLNALASGPVRGA